MQGRLFGDVKPTVLVNDKATRDAVLGALKNLRKQVKANDLLVVFFAGHGAKDGDQFYLLTHEAKVNQLEGTALSGREVAQRLKGNSLSSITDYGCMPFRRLWRPGRVDEEPPQAGDRRRHAHLHRRRSGRGGDVAAMGTEEASENGEHGLFTLELVKALTDKQASFNHANKKQYLHHLQADVFDWVVDESKDKQHPFLHLPWVMQSFPVRKVTAK